MYIYNIYIYVKTTIACASAEVLLRRRKLDIFFLSLFFPPPFTIIRSLNYSSVVREKKIFQELEKLD